MRLLISGSTLNTNSLGHFLIKHFDTRQITYEFLRFHDEHKKLTSRAFSSRLLNRVYPEYYVHKMDSSFIEQAECFRPDVVLVFKGMEISHKSLKHIRSKGIKTVNYNLDHPYEFFSRGSGNRFVRNSIPYYDLHITYSQYIQKQLQEKFNVSTAWLPFGYQLTDVEFKDVVQAKDDEVLKACFVGNPDKIRNQSINELLKNGIDVDVYGYGWEKVRFEQKNAKITCYPPQHPYAYWLEPVDFWRTIRKYRLQLNFFRPHNVHSHNLRTFEVPSVGGILLSPGSLEQKDFFSENKEMFFYEDIADLIQQCKAILTLSADDIKTIRSNARARSVTSGYSYWHRADALIQLLTGLF